MVCQQRFCFRHYDQCIQSKTCGFNSMGISKSIATRLLYETSIETAIMDYFIQNCKGTPSPSDPALVSWLLILMLMAKKFF